MLKIKKMSDKNRKKLTLKKTPVTRKFLMKLADSIYNTKTRKFLRLCDGTLQNGPDPTNPRRPMHCGLGELYFAMTGGQPELTGVDEADVVNMAFDRSSLGIEKKKAVEAIETERALARATISKLKISDDFKQGLLEHIDNIEIDEEHNEDYEPFKDILNEIPEANDDNCGHDMSCSLGTFRERSQRVASKLREAAKLLPK